MRHFPALFLHELRLLFISPASYIAAVLFLLLMGFLYFWNLNQIAISAEEVLPTQAFFQAFWLPVLFMVPLLTMRSLAEERRMGTLASLLSTPVHAAEVVLSKFFGAYVFYLLLWGLTLGFPLAVYLVLPNIAREAGLLDPVPLLGGYLFVAVSGLLYLAIGIFTSCLTRSQLVAGMLSFCLLFMLVIVGQLVEFIPLLDKGWEEQFRDLFGYLRSFEHLSDFCHGIVDTRPFFLYASSAFMLLGVTTLLTETRS